MFLFPAYAVLVWIACYRLRRRYLGYACLVAAVAGVLGTAQIELLLERWLSSSASLVLLQALLVAEAGIVLLVGAFLVSCPRIRVELPCRRCGYELDGLDDSNPTCPECGLAHAARKVRAVSCRCCGARTQVARGEDPCCLSCSHRAPVPPAAAA